MLPEKDAKDEKKDKENCEKVKGLQVGPICQEVWPPGFHIFSEMLSDFFEILFKLDQYHHAFMLSDLSAVSDFILLQGFEKLSYCSFSFAPYSYEFAVKLYG